MNPLLFFKAVSIALIALCAFTGLVLLLISAMKEWDMGPPLRGAATLAFFLAGLCAALALFFVYQIQKQASALYRLETVCVQSLLSGQSS
jgi:hypothetical protein